MRRFRMIAATGLVLAVASTSQAHSIAVLANTLASAPGGKVTIFLAWGHRLPVDELVSGEDLTSYEVRSPSGNVIPLERDERSLQANELVLDETGVYQVVVTRKSAVFTRYADADGKSVFAMGGKDEVELPEGAEILMSARSTQFGKAMLMSGSSEGNEPVGPLGHALEIVIESVPGPLGFSMDDPVRAVVLFQGEPVAGAKVFASHTSLNPDGSPEVSADADDEGRVTLDLVEPGIWILTTTHQAEAPEASRESHDTESFLATFSVPVDDDM